MGQWRGNRFHGLIPQYPARHGHAGKWLIQMGFSQNVKWLCIAFWVQGMCHRVFSGTANSPTAATTHQQVMLGQGYGAHYLADGSSYHGEWVCDLDILRLSGTEASAVQPLFGCLRGLVPLVLTDMSMICLNIILNITSFAAHFGCLNFI